MKEFVEELSAAVAFSRESRELKRDPEAAALWRDVYPDLSEGRTGLFGAVISRAEAQVLRVSMVFALLDCSPLIRRDHLLAGLAVWTYAEDSARYIFGDALGDPIADDIIRALRVRREGRTRSEIHDLFRRHRSEAEISRALSLLMQNGLATWRKEETGGRPVERWFANQRCERSE